MKENYEYLYATTLDLSMQMLLGKKIYISNDSW